MVLHLHVFHSNRSDRYLVDKGYYPEQVRRPPNSYNFNHTLKVRLIQEVVEKVTSIVRTDDIER